MVHRTKSIRPFIGAKNYEISRSFYRELGFQESVITPDMSYFKADTIGFYLQHADVKDWIDNTMVFVEVDDIDRYWQALSALELNAKYEGVRLTPIKNNSWGRECFLHDPSGILWHFGVFFAMPE